MSGSAEDDVVLLDRWRSGDRDAGQVLFQRHGDAVIRFFRNKVRVEVQDLTQETFVRIVAARDRIANGESFRAFVLGVARRVLFEYLRGLGREQSFDAEVDSVAALLPGPSSIAARKLEQRLLIEGLRRLPVDHQVMLELYYWEGIRAMDLAAILGVPASTMRSRLARARELLREQIAALTPAQELIVSSVAEIDEWAEQVRVEHLLGELQEAEP